LNVEEDFDQNEYFTEETKKAIFELAGQPNIYDILVDSVAPSIWENDDVKKGILCQLFGGCKKEFSQAGRGRFRYYKFSFPLVL
jgi:DNA replication licensing factor MCM4